MSVPLLLLLCVSYRLPRFAGLRLTLLARNVEDDDPPAPGTSPSLAVCIEALDPDVLMLH